MKSLSSKWASFLLLTFLIIVPKKIEATLLGPTYCGPDCMANAMTGGAFSPFWGTGFVPGAMGPTVGMMPSIHPQAQMIPGMMPYGALVDPMQLAMQYQWEGSFIGPAGQVVPPVGLPAIIKSETFNALPAF